MHINAHVYLILKHILWLLGAVKLSSRLASAGCYQSDGISFIPWKSGKCLYYVHVELITH